MLLTAHPLHDIFPYFVLERPNMSYVPCSLADGANAGGDVMSD